MVRQRFSATAWLADVRRTGATLTNTLGVLSAFVFEQPADPADRNHQLRLILAAPNVPEHEAIWKSRFGVRAVVSGFGMTEINIVAWGTAESARPGTAGRVYDRHFEVEIRDPAATVLGEVQALGVKAAACIGNVTEEGFAERFVATAIDELGGLDMVVNNAGYTWDATIGNTTDAQFQAMIDVHLVAPFRILRAASELLRALAKREAADGREVFRKVVNVSSVAGLGGNVGQVGYSSAKASLIGLTRTMAKEWGRFKVNVNCVAFGLIETRLTQPIAGDQASIAVAGQAIKVGVRPEMLDMMERSIPLGRAGTPEEAANAVYLFCSPESDYISGQVIVAGGGLTL